MKDENAKLRAELETARAYARHERDIGAEEVAQANASLILTLQDDLAEAIDALKPFAEISRQNKNYDGSVLHLGSFSLKNCNRAHAIVEKHR